MGGSLSLIAVSVFPVERSDIGETCEREEEADPKGEGWFTEEEEEEAVVEVEAEEAEEEEELGAGGGYENKPGGAEWVLEDSVFRNGG